MAGGTPTVSVALCTRDGAEFVAAQLASIVAQTLPPSEIVLSDDASVDSTVRIVEEAIALANATRAIPIRLVVLRNPVALGVAKNFERAIAACTGDLIALSDQDDLWQPDRLALIVVIFAERPELDLLHSDAVLINSVGISLDSSLFESLEISEATRAEVHGGRSFDVLMRRNIATGATMVFRRTLFDRAAPFADGWVHDEWLAIVAAAYGGLDLTESRLIRYRQHGSNQIGVEQLGIVGKIARMLEPGWTRSERLLLRATSLEARLRDRMAELPPERHAAAVAKLEHERVRSGLSVHRVLRVTAVVREMRTGRYSRFGRGRADAARDLLQPLRRPR